MTLSETEQQIIAKIKVARAAQKIRQSARTRAESDAAYQLEKQARHDAYDLADLHDQKLAFRREKAASVVALEKER